MPPKTANRSSAPHIAAIALSTRADSVTVSAPSGVSISTTTSNGASALTCWADSVSPASRSCRRCGTAPAGRVRGRRWRRVDPDHGAAGSSGVSTSAARAASRSLAATPSSRSRITTSAAAAAFSNRSGRSAGRTTMPGRSARAPSAPRIFVRSHAHHGLSCRGGHHVAVLIAAGVRQRHDAFTGPALGFTLVDHQRLGVYGVTVEKRLGKAISVNPRLATMVPCVSWATDNPTSVDNVNIELTSRWLNGGNASRTPHPDEAPGCSSSAW